MVPPTPQRASAKSLEPPPKRWGLILLVLLIDLGLAAGGVVLLREGLREAPAPSGSAGSASAGSSAQAEPVKPAAPPPAIAQPPPPPQPEPVAAAPAPTPAPVEPPAAGSGSNRARTKIHVTNRRAGAGPIDPYDDLHGKGSGAPTFSLSAQIDRLMAHSKPAFDGCYTAVMKSVPPEQAVHGTIKIAFRILPDGHLERVVALDNGTGSEQLAACIAAEIGTWALPAHPGDAVDFVRPFNF